MSLLMEALREAEREKAEGGDEAERFEAPLEAASETSGESDEEDSLLRLDLSDLPGESLSPPPESQPVSDAAAVPDREEEREEEATEVPETAPASKTPPDSRVEAMPVSSPARPEPEARERSPGVARGAEKDSTEAANGAGDKRPEMAQALFQAKARTRRHALLFTLLVVTCVLCLAALGTWYYHETARSETFVLAPPVEGNGEDVSVGEASPAPLSVAEGTAAEGGESKTDPLIGTQEPKTVPDATKEAGEGASPASDEVPAGDASQVVAEAAASSEVTANPKMQSVPEAKEPSDTEDARLPASVAEVYRQAMDEMSGSPSLEAAIQIRRSTRKARTAGPVHAAWKAFQERRYDEADRRYAAILADRPFNRDALLGRAAVALVEGRKEDAGNFYLRLLERDPEDPLAVAGLVSLQGRLQPVEAIARMRQLIDQYPGNGALHFILGNLYAAQSRWGHAQQAYFKAYSSDPEHADYLFNLAVSLDHLGKSELALKFYRQALRRAGEGGFGFSVEAVSRRIRALAGQAGGGA